MASCACGGRGSTVDHGINSELVDGDRMKKLTRKISVPPRSRDRDSVD